MVIYSTFLWLWLIYKLKPAVLLTSDLVREEVLKCPMLITVN